MYLHTRAVELYKCNVTLVDVRYGCDISKALNSQAPNQPKKASIFRRVFHYWVEQFFFVFLNTDLFGLCGFITKVHNCVLTVQTLRSSGAPGMWRSSWELCSKMRKKCRKSQLRSMGERLFPHSPIDQLFSFSAPETHSCCFFTQFTRSTSLSTSESTSAAITLWPP